MAAARRPGTDGQGGVGGGGRVVTWRDAVGYHAHAYPTDRLVELLGRAASLGTREFAIDTVASTAISQLAADAPATRLLKDESGLRWVRRRVFVRDSAELTDMMVNREVYALRISAGAVYTGGIPRIPYPYSERWAGRIMSQKATACGSGAVPIEREFVLDIDADALDAGRERPAARSCGCTESATCRACWWIIIQWARYADRYLDAMGYAGGAALWSYSGGRGMHCWVGCHTADASLDTAILCARTRAMGDRERAALCARLSGALGPKVQQPVETPDDWQGSIEADLARSCTLPAFFSDHFAGNGGPHQLAALRAFEALTAASDVKTRAVGLLKQLSACSSMGTKLGAIDMELTGDLAYDSLDARADKEQKALRIARRASELRAETAGDITDFFQRCRDISSPSSSFSSSSSSRNPAPDGAMEMEMAAIVGAASSVLCPRLDAAVSARMDHLLKVPLSMHCGTGRIAIPVRRADLAGFTNPADPTIVPHIIPGTGSLSAPPAFSSPFAFVSALTNFSKIISGLLY